MGQSLAMASFAPCFGYQNLERPVCLRGSGRSSAKIVSVRQQTSKALSNHLSPDVWLTSQAYRCSPKEGEVGFKASLAGASVVTGVVDLVLSVECDAEKAAALAI
jgi:hypothetical protein